MRALVLSRGLLYFFFSLLFGVITVSAMELRHMALVVAGKDGVTGNVNGPIGTSELTSPFAVCPGRTSDELFLGDGSYFRTYSRSMSVTGTLFGSATSGVVDGPIATAQLTQPQGCVTATINTYPIVYFVEGGSLLRYIYQGTVYSAQLRSGGSFRDVTLHEGRLYVVEDIARGVYVCALANNGAPTCTQLPGFSGCPYNQYVAITITAQGVFLAASQTGLSGLCWFSMDGRFITSLSGAYSDIYGVSSGALYAATGQEIHHITATLGTPSTMTAQRFVGDASRICPPSVDGYDPTICLVRRIYVVAENEMYLTAERSILRAVTLPPAIVHRYIPRPPLPVGYPDQDTVMTAILALMDSALNAGLSTPDTAVGRRSILVEVDTWRTDVEVEVQQQYFENATTPGLVHAVDFTDAERYVRQYYDLTNEVVFTDTNIIPYCNATMMRELEHGLVQKVRTLLNFPLIYCDPPRLYTESMNPNVTGIKLLMPASFGNTTHVNETTTNILSAANLTDVVYSIVREMYGPNNKYTLTLPNPPFDFSRLAPRQQQEVRWYILDKIQSRLRECREQVGGTSGESSHGGSASGSDSDGTSNWRPCNVTISNRTETQMMVPPYGTNNHYEVFIPDGMGYGGFNVSRCLSTMDWSSLEDWLNNNSIIAVSSSSTCNRGCIIGVAVAAAVVVTALIVLIVVLTSKRRRLAAVVAPSQPKFRSTLDDEDVDDVSNNPLDNDGHAGWRAS